MIEILNNATEKEVAIIVGAVRTLLNKKPNLTTLKMPISTEWDIYKTRKDLINNKWENKSVSTWVLNSRVFE